MKNKLLVIILSAICSILVIVSSIFIIKDINRNKMTHADIIRYTTYDFSNTQKSKELENVYFKYINDNTIKIIESNGTITIIDSSKLDYIKINNWK